MRKSQFSVLAEIDVPELFENESVNWRWCVQHANYQHRFACEFIIYIGPASEDYADNVMADMKSYGCTSAFVEAYEGARESGALRVLFYV
jgi:hypothetical protein